MLKVFFTTDTEIWPRSPDWKNTTLEKELNHYIYGRTTSGAFGIEYQMDVLESNKLKGVFLVEALFADCVGVAPLRKMTQIIKQRGHDVQLHIHTEWLNNLGDKNDIGAVGVNMMDFNVEQQCLILKKAIENLKASGVNNICAFRAGNYGANLDTLTALSHHGILFDTSFNLAYHYSPRRLSKLVPSLHPKFVHTVCEMPVTFFEDWPGHFRHLQLGACSFEEMRNVLLFAWKRNWYAVVIVSHSFEMLKRQTDSNGLKPGQPDSIVIKRFEKLCQFLGANNDKFESTVFANLDAVSITPFHDHGPYQSSWGPTLLRHGEQLARMIL